MALDNAEVKIADLTAQLQECERGERRVYDAGVAYSEPGFDQALANCLNGMRVWPSEGAATVSRAINSEYAEVIAQCTAVRYGSDGAPEESRWMLIRTAVSSMPESELGWVPLECCAEYNGGKFASGRLSSQTQRGLRSGRELVCARRRNGCGWERACVRAGRLERRRAARGRRLPRLLAASGYRSMDV